MGVLPAFTYASAIGNLRSIFLGDNFLIPLYWADICGGMSSTTDEVVKVAKYFA